MKEIREYQQEAIDTVTKKVSSSRNTVRGMLVMATGTGKTFTAVKAMSANNFKKILWLTHTEELIDQSAKALIYEYLTEVNQFEQSIIEQQLEIYADVIDFKNQYEKSKKDFFADDIEELINDSFGIIKAERMDTNEPLIIASVQTIHRRLHHLPSNTFDCIIIDECDLAGAKTWQKVIDHFNPKLLLGLTATPYRTDGMLLTNLFDEILYEYPIEKGIQDQHLCELDAVRIRTDLSLDEVRTTAGEFNQKDLEQAVNTPKRNQLIVDSYEKYALGRQFMAFCVDVKHAIDLTNTFKNRGYNVDFVVGDETVTKDRKGTIAKFKNKELLGLINVMVLTVGFDYSEVSCLIKARPTKSRRVFMQGVGRGTRLKKGQFKDCIILDFVDNTRKHTLVNTLTLDEGKTIENKIFINKKNKDELIQKREARKFRPETFRDEKVNLFQLPEVKVYYSGRNLEPASDKQLLWLEKLGYDTANIDYNKAMATEIISSQPTWSKKDIEWLRIHGYDVSVTPTLGQVERAKKEIEERLALKKSNIKLPFGNL